jgi:HSP20 family molecular chaperone IbpA
MALIRWTTEPALRAVDQVQQRLFAPVDVHREGDNLLIEVALPGFAPGDVDVRVDDDRLVVDAKRHEQQEHRDQDCLRHESFTGHVHREIPLPDHVRAEQAQARLENGMLKVTVPLPEPSRAHRIPVGASSERR